MNDTMPEKWIGIEVSCQLPQRFIAACREQGMPDADIVHGIPYPIEHLTRHQNRISFEANRQIYDNICAFLGEEKLYEMAQNMLSMSIFRQMSYLFRLGMTPRDIYLAFTRESWMFSSSFPAMKIATLRDISPGHLVLTFTLFPGFNLSKSYLIIESGLLAGYATFFGLPPAVVTSTFDKGVSRHEIKYEHRVPFLRKVFEYVRFPLYLNETRKSMEEARNELEQRYVELEAETQERLRAEKALLEISAREQERIRQDLHDTAGQELTALNYKVRNMMDALAGEGEKYRELGQELFDTSTRVSEEVRRAIRGLTPVDPYPNGLVLGVKDLIENTQGRTKSQLHFVEEGTVALDDHHRATHLFRIVQEALNNAIKYAEAENITVTLAVKNGTLSVCVEDDGKGMDLDAARDKGMGLTIMQYRANILGGELEVTSAFGKGTCIQCAVPNVNRIDSPQQNEQEKR